MDVATGVNKKKTASRPILEACDHMKLKYHSVGSFNHKPSQGLDVNSPTPGDYSAVDSNLCLIIKVNE